MMKLTNKDDPRFKLPPDRPNAYWINDGGRMLVVMKWKCSNCGTHSAEKSNYCPHCGSRMLEIEKKE